jgi:molecular chaperone GrpE
VKEKTNKSEKNQAASQKQKISENVHSKSQDEFNKLKKKINELEDKLLRTMAENENLRKRHEKEIQDSIKYSSKEFAYSLLTVVDNFQRALSSIPVNEKEKNDVTKNLVIGIQAVEKELHNSFEKNGIKMFDSLNEKFNPELHQAISRIHSDVQEGKIVEEMQKGFMIGDRLLRPAMVVVSMGPNKENEESKKK